MEIKDLQNSLRGHVWILGAEIGERNIWHPRKLESTAQFIKKSWLEQGYEVKDTVEGQKVLEKPVAGSL